jgi:hypothetical protein
MNLSDFSKKQNLYQISSKSASGIDGQTVVKAPMNRWRSLRNLSLSRSISRFLRDETLFNGISGEQ